MTSIFEGIFGGGEEPAPAPTPTPPAEDPEVRRQRELAQQRAEQERVRAVQQQLAAETQATGGRFGVRTLLGDLGFRTTRLGAG